MFEPIDEYIDFDLYVEEMQKQGLHCSGCARNDTFFSTSFEASRPRGVVKISFKCSICKHKGDVLFHKKVWENFVNLG